MSLEEHFLNLNLSSSSDSSSSDDEDLSSSSDSSSSDDESYYGLQGLDPGTVLYRACREDEDTDENIVCKDSDSDRSVEQHIASGSKYPSRFISTTTSSDVVLKWAKEGQPIIKIDLSRMTAGMEALDEMINLTNTAVREHFIKGATHRSWAKSSKEVLFQWHIPKKNASGENVFELSDTQIM
jgi:hypothetical protein